MSALLHYSSLNFRSNTQGLVRCVVGCFVSFCLFPATTYAKTDPCFLSWKSRLGEMEELRPSRLAGFREARLTDGNVIFIDRLCSKIVVGEVIDRDDLNTGQSTERVDRNKIDYSSLITVGSPQKNGWIFGVYEHDLPKFSAEISSSGKHFESYFLLIASDRAGGACSSKSSSYDELAIAAKKCEVSSSVYLALFGGRIPFAVDSFGRKYDVDDWRAFLTKSHR